jgi:hypothetical protein
MSCPEAAEDVLDDPGDSGETRPNPGGSMDLDVELIEQPGRQVEDELVYDKMFTAESSFSLKNLMELGFVQYAGSLY